MYLANVGLKKTKHNKVRSLFVRAGASMQDYTWFKETKKYTDLSNGTVDC